MQHVQQQVNAIHAPRLTYKHNIDMNYKIYGLHKNKRTKSAVALPLAIAANCKVLNKNMCGSVRDCMCVCDMNSVRIG